METQAMFEMQDGTFASFNALFELKDRKVWNLNENDDPNVPHMVEQIKSWYLYPDESGVFG